MMWTSLLFSIALSKALLASATPVSDRLQGGKRAPSAGLEKLEHLVFFMQENRAYDHYFGSMAGTRGFKDPNVHISPNTGKPVWHQPLNASLIGPKLAPPDGVTELFPWHVNHEGGDANEKTQCALFGSNAWTENHAAWNHGATDQWANKNSPYSLAYQRREDIPLHFALAENWIVGDAYHESITAATNPNRVAWLSGSVNVPGNGKLSSDLGGPVFDNHVSEGCEQSTPDGPKYTCYPFKWKTVPEYLEEVGITWQVYQDTDNFDDNPLAHFTAYQNARNDSSLAKRGMSFIGLDKFYEDAKNGNLPQVSYIVGPTDLSEHPPYGPLDGAWLQQQVVDALLASPKWGSTALLLSYDETGGLADHVYGPVPPRDAPGEWVSADPFDPSLGAAPVGPGFRLPFYILSPYTRKGGVFTEVATHESQTMFLEEWAAALGKPFQVEAVPSWRRSSLSNLVKAFDFSHADTSSPDDLPRIRKASQDPKTGQYNGAAVCAAKYPDAEPEIPYTKNTDVSDALFVEDGFKAVRGDLTEGRYLVFETAGKGSSDTLALAYGDDGSVKCAKADTEKHAEPSHRFILYATDSTPNNRIFRLSNTESYVADKKYVSAGFEMTGDADKAAQFHIEDLGNGQGHQVKLDGKSLACGEEGAAPTTGSGSGSAFSVFAVTY